jgi:hypothetical protein
MSRAAAMDQVVKRISVGSGVFGRIEAGIHTGQDREMAARRQRQVAFIPEILRVFGVCSQHFIQDLGQAPRLLFKVPDPPGRSSGPSIMLNK